MMDYGKRNNHRADIEEAEESVLLQAMEKSEINDKLHSGKPRIRDKHTLDCVDGYCVRNHDP